MQWGKIFGFLFFVLFLPAMVLWGGHWAVTTHTPSFSAALAGITPYLILLLVWCAMAYVAGWIFFYAVED